MNPLPARLTPALADTLGAHPRFVEAFAHGSLCVELYAPRGTDAQAPHARDEVYVVVAGRGRFSCDGEIRDFAPGELLFVPAGMEHRFLDFTDDFVTWVLFYGPEGGEARMAPLPPGEGLE
jgi:mannose-6-phosphate isomerase-like protein (cupin superfamily)